MLVLEKRPESRSATRPAMFFELSAFKNLSITLSDRSLLVGALKFQTTIVSRLNSKTVVIRILI